jgi:peptide/nickel transport system substrate-binding protein
MMSPSFPRAVAAGVLAAVVLAAATGQPPEIEDTKPRQKKRIVVDDPPEPPKGTVPGSDATVRLGELAAAAETAPPGIKAVLEKYVVPFDRFTLTSGGTVRVKPIPIHRSEKFPAEFGVQYLNPAGNASDFKNVAKTEVRRIEHFEEMAQAEAEIWLRKSGKDEPPIEQLAAAEKLLAATLRFHDATKAPDRRSGKAWDEVRKAHVERLKDARLRELRAAAKAGNWDRVGEAATILLKEYPRDKDIAREAADARVAEVEQILKSKTFADQVRAKERLDDLVIRHGDPGGEAVGRVRKELGDEAKRLLVLAKAERSNGNAARARDYARQAESLDPESPGLRDLRLELGTGSTVLTVGARVFPERLSPATARFDSEKHVVELLFESLVEEVPDIAGGTRYRPGAAVGPPLVIQGGREFDVRITTPRGDQNPGFDATDVAETVKLYRTRPELWAAAALPYLDDLPTPTGSGGVRVGFRHGHPDPRSLLTFKLLPARWMADKGKKIDDAEFSARPVGTGPFRYQGVSSDPKTGARTLTLADNPGYARTKDRTGLPHLREVRFVELEKVADPFGEFRGGRLNIIPDLTPAELAKALDQNAAALGGKGVVHTAAVNRRVYVLALNHRQNALQNRDLRRGLALAIDREGVVQELLGGVPAAYRRTSAALVGPYPAGSWAAAKGRGGLPTPLVDRTQAIVSMGRYLSNAAAPRELKLVYPAGDSSAKPACERIKVQVESLFKDAPPANRLTLAVEPLAPRDFVRHVETEQRYDLAYLPFDYPDDWHPFGLAAYLDPDAAVRDGRNVTGYLAPGTNPDADDRALGAELAAFREHRDYTGDLVPRAARVQALFNDRMPFVPLWQLDRHALVASQLKIVVDDAGAVVPAALLEPNRLFHNPARWRMD